MTNAENNKDKNETLNDYGKYVCEFAKNHGITIAEAYEHPMCIAKLDEYNFANKK